MHYKTFIYVLTGFFTLLSCNSNKDEKTTDKTTTTEKTQNTTNSTADKKAERASITVTITGGDMAGIYTATCTDACCSWGLAGENVFGNQYSENGKGPKEISSVQLIVDDVKQGNKSTNEFTTTVSFGELFGADSKSFNINTRDGKTEGSGQLDLQYEGEKAVVTIKGTSKEGPGIELKMECHKVMTASTLGQ